ncbi:hypothetical protein DM02DRAFT_407835 [Periconia macrospinosa]|uniref:Uncharacterized protein n=1 Tax=Periconia macrospinosa TaxID=97972 RepID=A0A2V1EBY3_9PLEO|nr:hypothetical protein DM02DRAFT_407835 [Periconia macrospinosa]
MIVLRTRARKPCMWKRLHLLMCTKWTLLSPPFIFFSFATFSFFLFLLLLSLVSEASTTSPHLAATTGMDLSLGGKHAMQDLYSYLMHPGNTAYGLDNLAGGYMYPFRCIISSTHLSFIPMLTSNAHIRHCFL